MKTTEFKQATKHLGYWNNLSKICECFEINVYKYREILTLENGFDWLINQFEKIEKYEELVANAIEKALSHKKTKSLKGFISGYSMGEYTAIQIVSSFQSITFTNTTIIDDNRSEYKGKKSFKATHGHKIAVFKMASNGSIRFIKFDEKIK